MMSLIHLFSVVALLASNIAAQTSTQCNPLNATCPEDPALGTTYATTFNSSMTQLDSNFWNVTSGTDLITFSDKGADLTITKHGDSFTAQSNFYIFFGSVEVIMQAAPGQGIISTIVLLSDDLDEIDIEIMGGNTSYIESNWYGHGNLSQFNALYHPCDGPAASMHNYTVVWTQEQIQWIIDGNVARTLPSDASGKYPQTPSFVRFGVWAAGDPSEPNGTITWAGGETDYTKGPFTMTVQSLKITDFATNTSAYTYSDQSGTAKSITSTPGESVAYKLLHQLSSSQKIAQSWSSLSTTARIGIIAGSSAAAGILLIAFSAFCVVQRRRGKRERIAADRLWEQEHQELLDYKRQVNARASMMTREGRGEKF